MYKSIAGGGFYDRPGNGALSVFLTIRIMLRRVFQLISNMTTILFLALFMEQNINTRTEILQ